MFCLIPADCVEESNTDSLDDTVVEQTIHGTSYESEVRLEKTNCVLLF